MNYSLFSTIHSWFNQRVWLDYLFLFMAVYSGYVLVAVLILKTFVKSSPRKRLMFLEAVAAAILSRLVITEVIRLLYHHPRPFEAVAGVANLINESGWSFPSGHAALFIALSAIVWIYYRRLGVIFFFVMIAMAIARIAVGVHWPLDILGGLAVGLLSAWLVHYVARKSFGKVS